MSQNLKSNNVDLVDVSSVQDLTNKTIDGSLNTLSNIPTTALEQIEAVNVAYDNISSGLTSTDVQSAIDELETLIVGLPNPIIYKGTWDASTNTPTLSNSDTGVGGNLYRVTVAGSVDFGAGSISFDIGDSVVNNSTNWEKWDHSDQVLSVNSQTGAVVLDTGDISESGNLYFTDERAQDAVGGILTNSSKISLSYNDGLNTISSDVVTGSLVNADINSSAAIDWSKMANLTTDRALVSDSNGDVSAATTTATEIGYVNGVTSSIQTQLDAKQLRSTLTAKGDLYAATASNTVTNLPVGNNGEVLTADSAMATGMKWAAASATSGINYISNPNATATISPWVAYSDSPGSIPVDGTGGTPTVTVTRDTNSLTIGANSILLTKTAADSQGQGASIDFTISTASKNCPVEISTYLNASANFVFGSIDGVTPSDVTVYVYDVTNSALITIFPNVITSNLGKFTGSFQASSSTSYRLIFHIGTTNALAWTLALGEVVATPLNSTIIPANSDWVAYTPTFSGTVTSTNLWYRKEGTDVLIQGIVEVNATGAGATVAIGLPTGLVAGSRYTGSNLTEVGRMTKGSNAAISSKDLNILITAGSSVMNASVINDLGIHTLAAQTGTSILTASLSYSLNARIQVQGWTSGYATPAVSAQNIPVTFFANKANGSISTNTTIPAWTNVLKDSVGAFNATTGVYQVRVSGDYFVNASLTMGSSTVTLAIRKNGTIVANFNPGISGTRKQTTALLPNLAVGDTITLTISGNDTIGATAEESTWSIYKIVDPSAFLNIPKVATIQDQKASGTDGGTFTQGAYQTRTLNTLVDPFGIVSLASNQFTLQPGTYKIYAKAPAFGASGTISYHKAKLRNITDSTDTVIGSTERIFITTTSLTNASIVDGVFSISSAKVFEIQHRCAVTQTSTGFGAAATFGDVEVYTQVEIQKLL